MTSEFNSMEDLVFSRSFRNWVLDRDPPEKSYWDHWVERHPDKAEMVKYAKGVIYALHLDKTALSESEIDEEVRKALNRLKEAPRYIPLDGPAGHEQRRRGWHSPRLWLLTVLAAGIGVAGFFYGRAHLRRDVLKLFLFRHKGETMRELTSDAFGSRTLFLPDSSLVRLGKSSKLYVPAEWGRGENRREVFLEGEAFFDIRRDPSAPFYIYTGQVVTEVLGKSLVINAFPADSRATVTDMTGNVMVFRADDYYPPSAERREPAGVVLTSNQEVVYDRTEDRLHKTLAEMPEPLGDKPDSVQVWQRTPVRQVFGYLRDLYGIPIQFDEEALDSCMVSVNMNKESFYDKLTSICKAIGGSYRVIDGNVIVTAKGCK